jgi:hypothetical protein
VEKMQLIFFVPPNEELEGTLHPQKFGCTPKNEGKRVHVPPDENTCGHAEQGSAVSFYFITWYEDLWFQTQISIENTVVSYLSGQISDVLR